MLNGGRHYNRLQSKVTVNRDFKKAVALPATVNCLMEAGGLRQPPPLMMINGGGCLKVSASIKQLTKAVSITQPPQIKIYWWRSLVTCQPPLIFSHFLKNSLGNLI